ncbi:Ribosomal protein L20A (L18A) [Halalkaliarchaeum sp. AArc-CO]|uniref:50S ribosomal protein L18Ae n=1 Tax=unclassified Halalkaliarchaeum TaxID=2678344 RepID=UPI00217DE126|nr:MULTISPECIES: 50S ribosomal protein L18Ae [unclassified Halalkaliarchaeum]MDR5673027.1 50S ribosomal protein L18Ae [Halalkaliarchaeum sp. AArc-GB]UWG49506.1 Ribosomal protein L20A (L18A) [Halalkaliarchaeum sp. AArc-CO]
MAQFVVSGRFQTREDKQPFERTIDAENESVAREHVFSQFGSEHGLKRTQVEIEEVAAQ